MAAQLYLFRFIYFQDIIYPSSGSHDLASDFPLVDVDHFSRKSALSGMLLKQWNKDKDISSELKQWVRTRNQGLSLASALRHTGSAVAQW